MINFVLVVIIVLLFAAWLYEKYEGTAALKEEKHCREAEAKVIYNLKRENRLLREKCGCTVEKAFSGWERKECTDIPGRVLFERDGIVLIYECGVIVGWYSVDTEQTVIHTTGCAEEYEAPSAEITCEAPESECKPIRNEES